MRDPRICRSHSTVEERVPWIVALVFIVRWSATTGPETVAPRMTTVPLLPTAPLLDRGAAEIVMLRSAVSRYDQSRSTARPR